MIRTRHRSLHRPATALAVIICAYVTAVPAAGQRSPEPQPPDKLGEKLIREARGETERDVMDAVTRLMEGVSRRLQVDFDTGEKTRAMQADILEKLDEAIKTAAAQRRPRRSRSQSSSSDKRRMTKKQSEKSAQQSAAAKQNDASQDASTNMPPGSVTDGMASGGQLQEIRRSWGNLPHREREEIIQGVDEQFLERYRTWIERYYRALQENDE